MNRNIFLASLFTCMATTYAFTTSAQVVGDAGVTGALYQADGTTLITDDVGFAGFLPDERVGIDPLPDEAKGFFRISISKSGNDIPAGGYYIVLSLPQEVVWTEDPITVPAEFEISTTGLSNVNIPILLNAPHTGDGAAGIRTINIPVRARAATGGTLPEYLLTLTPDAGIFADNQSDNNQQSAEVRVQDNPLAVSFVSFDVTKENTSAVLAWATSSEQNNRGFEIERSNDGKNWEEIGFVASKGVNGFSHTLLNYSFTDNNPLSGVNHYRLKQYDLDGKYSYSEVREVVFLSAANSIEIYPNPSNNIINVVGEAISQVTVYNISGQQINLPVHVKNGVYQLDVSNITSGNYTIQVSNGNDVSAHKIVVTH